MADFNLRIYDPFQGKYLDFKFVPNEDGSWRPSTGTFMRIDLNAVALGAGASLLTPTSGKKLRLVGGQISLSAAASIAFTDATSNTVILRTPKLLVDTPFELKLGDGFLLDDVDHALKATSSVAANVTGTLFVVEE